MPVPQRICVLIYIPFDSELNAEQNCKEIIKLKTFKKSQKIPTMVIQMYLIHLAEVLYTLVLHYSQ
jgi:hypothetical protein